MHPILGVRRVWCCGWGADGHQPCSACCVVMLLGAALGTLLGCSLSPRPQAEAALAAQEAAGSTLWEGGRGPSPQCGGSVMSCPVSTAGPDGPSQAGWESVSLRVCPCQGAASTSLPRGRSPPARAQLTPGSPSARPCQDSPRPAAPASSACCCFSCCGGSQPGERGGQAREGCCDRAWGQNTESRW